MQNLTICSFNVLHDNNPLYAPVLKSKIRFQYIAKQIANSNSDVFCLNQVNGRFWTVLNKYAHNYPYKTQPKCEKRGHCVAILSKTPLTVIVHRESTIVARIESKNGQPVILVATHLSAEEDHFEKRKKQLASLNQILVNLESSDMITKTALKNNNVILLGDLNLHLINETKILYENSFVDLWLEKGKDEKGYTWDPKVNKLINYFLPFDNRRMRLDRIAVKNKSNLKIQSINIIFNQKIPHTWYLFPSDHFGLQASFAITQQQNIYDHNQKVSKIENIQETGFRKIKTIILLRYLFLILLPVIPTQSIALL